MFKICVQHNLLFQLIAFPFRQNASVHGATRKRMNSKEMESKGRTKRRGEEERKAGEKKWNRGERERERDDRGQKAEPRPSRFENQMNFICNVCYDA